MKKQERVAFEKGAGFILISAFSVSVVTLCVKLGLKIESVPLLIFLRSFIPFLIFSAGIWVTGGFKGIFPIQHAPMHALRALAVIISQFALAFYLTRASVLQAALFWNLGPLFIPVISKLLHKQQRVGKLTWFTLILALSGVICFLKPNLGLLDPYNLLGLIVAVSMGFAQVLFGINAKRESSEANLFYFFLFMTFFSTIALLLVGIQRREETTTAFLSLIEGWNILLPILGMGVFTLLNQGFRALAYRFSNPTTLAPFLYASLIFAGIWDWLIFHKIPDGISILGLVIIFVATLLKWRFSAVSFRK